jgi:parallel beta-helix repeat protein
VFIGTNILPSISGVSDEIKSSDSLIGDKTVIYVPDDYPTIQSAVENASVGDTIFVYNDTYYEHVVIDKRLTLLGENRNTTIIDGSDEDSVVVVSADEVTISGFTIQNSGNSSEGRDSGIKLWYVDYCNITGNIVTNNGRDGIRLHYSYTNTVAENIITYNDDRGIIMFSASDNTIEHNTISYNEDDGIHLNEVCVGNYIELNVINDNLYDGIHVGSIGVRDTHIKWNTIANHDWGTGVGIRIDSSSDNRIDGNKLYSNNFGVMIYSDSTDNLVVFNTINDSVHSGVLLEDTSEYTTVAGNTLMYNEHGIEIRDDSNNNIIGVISFFNTISHNEEYGIYIHDDPTYNTIDTNLITNNNYGGIYLYDSSDNEIKNNYIKDNRDGIHLEHYSSFNTISINDISDSSRYGVYIHDGSNENDIYHNDFDNTDNARDYGVNTWCNTDVSEGNYWSDYEEKYPDATNDGHIWDTPYNISGGDNQDLYPLVYPWTSDVCGDANNDGMVAVGDIIFIINYLFRQGPPSNAPCQMDATGDGEVNLADIIYILNYLFRGGSPPDPNCCI